MKSCFYFTSFFLDALDAPEKGYLVHNDTEVPVLKLYITSRGAKSFFIRRRIRNKDERIIIGKYPEMSIERARVEAVKKFNKVKNIKKHSEIKFQDITLKNLVKTYLDKKLQRTEYGKIVLQRNINRFWEALLPFEMKKITEEHIFTLHSYIEKYHGPAMANRMLEIMRGIFRFAIQNNFAKENPALKVKKFMSSGRHRLLSSMEIKKLLSAIKLEKNHNVRDALLMLFFTGCQKSAVLSMKWDQLDFNQNFWLYKNKEIPLSNTALVLLEKITQKSVWVFPNKISRSGHIVDIKRPWARILKNSGLAGIQIDDVHKTIAHHLEILRQKTKDELKTFDFDQKLLNNVLNSLRIN